MSKFETAKQGEYAGQLVRLTIGATAIKRTKAPINRSRTGYGSKIPTEYMVQTIDNVWRRVYVMCYSNSGTTYVMHGKVRTIVELPI